MAAATTPSLGSILGPRLIYSLDLGGIGTIQVLLKEDIGQWLSLAPQYPDYGTFSKGPNKNKHFTKRPGFRGRSWKFLLKAGTSIPVPDPQWRRGGTTKGNRSCLSFEIGFSRKITAREAIEFVKNCKQSKNIVGIVSDTGRIYRWSGPLGALPGAGTTTPATGGTPTPGAPNNGPIIPVPSLPNPLANTPLSTIGQQINQAAQTNSAVAVLAPIVSNLLGP